MAGRNSNNVVGGGGPGEEFARWDHWIVPLAFLCCTTVAVLVGLYFGWPRCEEDVCRDNTQNAARSTVESAGGIRGAPASAMSAPVSSIAASAALAMPDASVSASGSAEPNPKGTARSNDSGAPSPDSSAHGGHSAKSTRPEVEIKSLLPTSGTMCGGTAVVISGTSFDKPKVRFGGLLATSSEVQADGCTIVAKTPQHWEGAVDVTVEVSERSLVLSKAFRYECPDHTQARLLLLVVLAGALGGAVHGLRSLFYFIGIRMLKRSWLPMYFALPLTSAAISTLFFLVFAAGFFSPQSGDGQSFFLMVGVSAIVGMFSPQAVEKLKKISEAILTSAPPAADKTPELILTAVDPAKGDHAGETDVVAHGSGFAQGVTVLFDGAAADVLTVTGTTIKLRTPPHPPGKVPVEVTNPDGATAVKLEAFEYI